LTHLSRPSVWSSRRIRKSSWTSKALLEILYNEFATNFLTGLPVEGVLFKPAKWKEQVSVYMGLPPPETRKSVNQHIIIIVRRYLRKIRLACERLTELSLRHWRRHISQPQHDPGQRRNGLTQRRGSLQVHWIY
jgi:hypothetical protein